MVGDVPHFAPSDAPPLGQNTETRVSFASQLAALSAWMIFLKVDRPCLAFIAFVTLLAFFAGCALRPLRTLRAGLPLGARHALDALRALGPAGPWAPGSPFGPGSRPQAASESAMATISMEEILMTPPTTNELGHRLQLAGSGTRPWNHRSSPNDDAGRQGHIQGSYFALPDFARDTISIIFASSSSGAKAFALS